MTRPETGNPQGFYGLGIAPNLLNALDALKFKSPTPIQEKSIPPAIQGQDLIGIAQTGTGKTLAFAIPMLQRISAAKKQGLVILPTRELALQVEETFAKVGGKFGLRTAVLIGGASMNVQRQMIGKRPHVIIATPGRLIDHLEQRTMNLNSIGILVLDEADRMLDMGFAPQINKILAQVPADRQTLLFSATMPEAISKIASKHMKLPLRVEIARAGTTAEKVSQELYVVRQEDKSRLLEQILTQELGSVLVFSRTKHGAKRIARTVRAMGHTASEIHANRSLNQRKEALAGFKSGQYRVLVATDIAARGIDVDGIELVINFDLPDQAEDYVHRIGRTGRAGRTGKAISFATPDQGRDVRDIEKLVRVQLPVTKLPELPPARAVSRHDDRPDQGGWRGGRGGSHGGGRSYGGGSRGNTGNRSRVSSGFDSRRPRSSSGPSQGSRGPSSSSTPSSSGPRRSGGGKPGGRKPMPKREYYGGMGV